MTNQQEQPDIQLDPETPVMEALIHAARLGRYVVLDQDGNGRLRVLARRIHDIDYIPKFLRQAL